MKEMIMIIISSADSKTTMNHDVAGGAGCKVMQPNFKVPPPLTCVYLYTILKEADYDVTVLDANTKNLSHEEIIKELKKKKLGAVLLYGSLPTIKGDMTLLKKMSRVNSNLIYASSVANNFTKELHLSGARIIISGDIEISIKEAIEQLKSKNNKLFCKKMNKQEMNELPFPDWSCLDMQKYSSYVISGSRGCEFRCPHCPYNAYQRSEFTPRDNLSILQEMKYLHEEFQVDYVLFRDPCFTYDLERTEEFLDKLIEMNLDMKWACETRIECLNEELVKKMAKAKCSHIRMGVEAADENILKNIGRLHVYKNAKDYLKQAANVTKWCKNNQINTMQFYMIGFPEESKRTILEMKKQIDIIDPDIAAINYIIPYPNTVYQQRIEEMGLIDTYNYEFYGSKDRPVSKTKYLSIEELTIEKKKLEDYLESRKREFSPI